MSDQPFSATIRMPMSLAMSSVLGRVMRLAYGAGDRSVYGFQSLHADMQAALREGRVDALHTDTLTIRFPDREARCRVDLRNTQFHGADRHMNGFQNGYEPDIAVLVDALVPNDGVLIDAGANWGYFGAYLAARPGFQGMTLAIEPFPASARTLAALVTDAGIRHAMEPIAVAVGAEPGTAGMSDHIETGLNAIRTAEPGAEAITVPVETVDRLVAARDLARVDLIKIDVEGTEDAVIRGARETINRFQPVINFESWFHAPDQAAAPFRAIEAIADYRFCIVTLEGGERLTGTLVETARVRGKLQPLTAATRSRFAERVNVTAYPVDMDLAARLSSGH